MNREAVIQPTGKLKVAILGSGNIGTDLLIKVLRSPYLECGAFIGRNLSSSGMMKALSLGVPVSADGIDYIVKNPDCCELVFDATSAKSHFEHAPILKKLNKRVIDLTPAKVGLMSVPSVNLEDCLTEFNVNMVTCGGQASIPVAYAIGQTQVDVEYIEVVSSIASRSAGPATRQNLDEYIKTTEDGIKEFSGAARTKAILNLNPAEPCVDMQTTIFAKVKHPDIEKLTGVLAQLVEKIRKYVPGYEIILGPIVENGRIVVMARVRGLGDYLPAYAGNLDIINCAAIAMAEEYARVSLSPKSKEH
ncbi:MAG: acetaldehyde dehydrogenase (acetylating) [Candidatus Paracaedibacteraceae bacterium]|nr:acetaldehyde dehydrogenase (acetylating) [Candidatus Paracaedibacteraceae bacterium]